MPTCSGPQSADNASSSPEELGNERFRLVVEASPNAIVVTNAAGRIELVNKEIGVLHRKITRKPPRTNYSPAIGLRLRRPSCNCAGFPFCASF